MSAHSRNAFTAHLNNVEFNFGNNLSPETRLAEYEAILDVPLQMGDPFVEMSYVVGANLFTASVRLGLFHFCGPGLTLPAAATQPGGFRAVATRPTAITTPQRPRLTDMVHSQGGAGPAQGARAAAAIIDISDFTCTYGPMSETTLAHELGHVFSDAIENDLLSSESTTTFRALRACLSAHNPNTGSSGISAFPEDDSQTEEDASDVLAMRYGSYVPNACSYLHPAGLDIPASQLLRQSDSHSAPLKRLIEAARRRGPLPPECETIVRANPEVGWHSCQ